MREDWKYQPLGEVCDILDSKRKPITKNKRLAGSIPYYGATGVLDYVKDYIFDEKLVLLGEDGAKWGAGENSAYIICGKSWVNNHAHALRPHRNIILDEFLVNYLNYSDLSESITGVTVPKLNQEKMRAIIIPVPPLTEQERIVALLDDQFAKIDALKANAASQLQAAKDLFQSALKEYLTPKEGWVKKSLKSIGKTQTGCTPSMSHKEFYNEDYIPFIKPSEINFDGVGGINYDTQKLSKLGAENGRVFEAGSIFMVCIGTIGKLGFSDREVSCNQQINVLTPSDGYNKKFIYYALLNPVFIKEVEIIARSAQATLPIISKGKWENLEVFIPSYKEQRDIVVILDSLSDKVARLQENYDQTITLCNDLKQSLLKSIFE